MLWFVKYLAVFLFFGNLVDAGIIDDINFVFYGTTNQVFNRNTLGNVVNSPGYDPAKKTVLYLYGITQQLSTAGVQDVISAYKTNGNFNLIMFSMPVYSYIFPNIKFIGEAVCEATNLMFVGGLDPANLHIVGFSLGAQTAGVIGRCILRTSNGEKIVGRITGLDSAIVDITTLMIIGTRLGQNDAAFVDTVHTNSDGFGSKYTYGHVNFWVNGGMLQPSCANWISLAAKGCSHSLAYTYWAESVRSTNQNIFESKQCKDWTEFTTNTCDASAPVGHMGLYASNTLRKNYYLSTNKASPYSL